MGVSRQNEYPNLQSSLIGDLTALGSAAAPPGWASTLRRHGWPRSERRVTEWERPNGKDVWVAGRSSLAEASHLANEPPLGVGHWLNRQSGQPG